MGQVAQAVFNFKPFSRKQKQVLTWWMDSSSVKDMDGIIADGAIRSGKTVSMSLSFVIWAMERFDQQNFAMCGKTVGSFRRNVLLGLKLMLRSRGYDAVEKRADKLLEVSRNGKKNLFYIFGGKDERSQDLIQGITLAGVFFDEVALMPRSFVEQATGRCSVEGSRFWFNCNPDTPKHWFKAEWIDKAADKNIVYLSFSMDDNLSLSEKVKARYRNMYSGVFYDRYVLGQWVVAEGLVYAAQAQGTGIVPCDPKRKYTRYHVSVDYGTANPFSMGLWGLSDGVWYRVREYYYDSRKKGRQLTDAEYYDALLEFVGNLPIDSLVVDPSALSFITLIRRKGRIRVLTADNDVLPGIRRTATAFSEGRLKVQDCCKDTIAEFSAYRWDEKANVDRPVKEHDHAMDDIRYFVNTILAKDWPSVVAIGR